MILQGTVLGGRRKGRQKKRWEDNITEWTGFKLGEALRKAKNRDGWRKVVAQSSLALQGILDYGISEVNSPIKVISRVFDQNAVCLQ